MGELKRCQYRGCQKFADTTVDGLGPVCYDHLDDARVVAAPDWKCPHCGTFNPQTSGQGGQRKRGMPRPLRLGFCLRCYLARE